MKLGSLTNREPGPFACFYPEHEFTFNVIQARCIFHSFDIRKIQLTKGRIIRSTLGIKCMHVLF